MIDERGQNLGSALRLRVTVGTTPEARNAGPFSKSFHIGRSETCEVCIRDDVVSRMHAEVCLQNGKWWIRDLQSANGTFIDGQRIGFAPIEEAATIRLGLYGPVLNLTVEQPEPAATVPPVPVPESRPVAQSQGEDAIEARIAERYFGKANAGQPMGEHTIMVRRAFERVQAKEKAKYGRVIGALAFCALAVGGYAVYLHQQTTKQRQLAQALFYAMKSLDLEISSIEKLVLDSGNQQAIDQVKTQQNRRYEMERNYDRFLASLRVYDPKMSEEDRLILRVARIFGECELTMPPGFVEEIRSYIRKWQSSGRLPKAIQAASDKAYTAAIASELMAQSLPPQFFYLALQESGLDPYAVGPATRKGVAKGMWQFIPETGLKYGLQVGPLADLRRPDPGDDRHSFEKSTKAAAQYLKDLYTSDAQASGLLVMACYNWGEDQVLPLVRAMPANPRERNFWRLLSSSKDKIPKETYDYVFYIFSAAVIGENPRLFGFQFDDPLAHLEVK